MSLEFKFVQQHSKHLNDKFLLDFHWTEKKKKTMSSWDMHMHTKRKKKVKRLYFQKWKMQWDAVVIIITALYCYTWIQFSLLFSCFENIFTVQMWIKKKNNTIVDFATGFVGCFVCLFVQILHWIKCVMDILMVGEFV